MSAGAYGSVAYGIDQQREALRVVRVERRGRKWVAQPVAVDDARFVAERARGVPVAAALGPRESITHWLKVKLGTVGKARKVLPTVLDIELPFPLEDCSYSFLAVQREADGAGVRALGVAARHQDLQGRLARLASASLDAALLDHEGLALWSQSISEVPVDAPETLRAVLCLEEERATLVLGVGDEYRSTHSVRIESLDAVRRLVRAAGGETPGRLCWWLAGGGAAIAEQREAVVTQLKASLGGSVKVHQDPAHFLARALAMRVVAPGPWGVNLRTGAFAHPFLQGRRAGALRLGLAAALVSGVLLGAVNAVAGLWLSRSADTQMTALRTLGQAVAGPALGGARGEQALLIVRRQLEALSARGAPYRAMLAPSLTVAIRAVLESAQLGGLELSAASWRAEAVSLAGQGRAWESAEPLVDTLDRLGYRVQLNRDTNADGAAPAVAFRIEAEAAHE